MDNFIELKKKINQIIELGWIKLESNNYSNVGIKLEQLLNINSGNFEIPDFRNIELKTKSSIFEDNISLFNATPDSFLFEIKRLHKLYGYYDNKSYKVLNKMVYSNKFSKVKDNVFFTLNVDFQAKNVYLCIFDNNHKLIDNQTAWSFEELENKLKRKLGYLCFVEAKKHYCNNFHFVKYTNVKLYKLKSSNCFFKLIDDGTIGIVFKIGVFKSGKNIGKIHDHGTSFCINKFDLNKLFDEVNELS